MSVALKSPPCGLLKARVRGPYGAMHETRRIHGMRSAGRHSDVGRGHIHGLTLGSFGPAPLPDCDSIFLVVFKRPALPARPQLPLIQDRAREDNLPANIPHNGVHPRDADAGICRTADTIDRHRHRSSAARTRYMLVPKPPSEGSRGKS